MPRARLTALRPTALGSTILEPGAVAAELVAPSAALLAATQRYLRHDDFAWEPVPDPAQSDLTRLRHLGPDTAAALAALGITDLVRLRTVLSRPDDDQRLIDLPGITARRLAAWRAQLQATDPTP